MRKIGLLSLAIVLALGALGVGYAMWTDTITIHGTVETGSVCLEFQTDAGEVVCTGIQTPDGIVYPDKNWSGWVTSDDPDIMSCPEGYEFEYVYCVNKDVGRVEIVYLDADDEPFTPSVPPSPSDPIAKKLQVTIIDAYPHFAADISFWMCNCGTVPVILQDPVIEQDDFLVIQYGDNLGAQVHPGGCVEISLVVGVVQHEGYEDPTSGAWIVDDDTHDILPQNAGGPGANDPPALTFTIEIPAKQWAE
jgi:hypothetical protein